MVGGGVVVGVVVVVYPLMRSPSLVLQPLGLRLLSLARFQRTSRQSKAKLLEIVYLLTFIGSDLFFEELHRSFGGDD